jgi:hypothetical protein
MEVSGKLHVSTAFTPKKVSSTHFIGGWVGRRGFLDVFEKR